MGGCAGGAGVAGGTFTHTAVDRVPIVIPAGGRHRR